ncbi:ABC transporter ATP-binding protein [Pseudothermotoga thermarum]|uniref:ABC transporter related protein n=1 Tax=Pseudothermotoga thermarum DSM 5069 TaxID=688269 RepID=F7YTG6_9THEM|nr:ABC transporter ATP-binding protein [Pseudothermotoga thermarum]AEH51180.1 ABC transporter related protein [Pseudothermotoga thermarum DSM 5069]
MEVVKVQGLKKYYGEVKALDDVTFSIFESEILAVIGPSGSGKTTLLRAIAGFVNLDSGRIIINSRDVTNVPPEKRNVSMFFQNYALWPHMTVYENVAYGLKIRKMSKTEIRERVEWALNFLEISHLANRKPSQLSGGQQQRVALARAIVVKPDVLLLDEPLSNLDAKIRTRIRSELRELLKKLNIPTLYVTHDQEEALSIADRIAVMNHGKILQLGTPQEIYKNPVDVFVADFVGANSLIRIKTKSGEQIKVGNKIFVAKDDFLTLVIRVDEADLLSAKQLTAENVPEQNLILKAVVVDKLFLGSKYKYKLKIDEIEEYVYLNSNKIYANGDKVIIAIPAGSYFVF